MNFDDEDYVRLYTRDTVTWKLLGWQGRTVMLHMLRGKFDRSGVFVTDRHALSRAVTAATDLPSEVVEEGLRQVLAEGVWLERDGCLVWPTFVEAQTAVRSDKARQRDTRKRRAAEKLGTYSQAESVTIRDASVTPRHAPSQPVTIGHPNLADPNRSEQSRAEPNQHQHSAADGGGSTLDGIRDDDTETCCPLDLADRWRGADEMADKLKVPRSAVDSVVRDFVAYWTIGAGVGKKRRHWARLLRQRVTDRAKVEHEQATGKKPGAIPAAGRALAVARAMRAKNE